MIAHQQEKRAFGRRKSDIRGSAIVTKDTPKPFTIMDLSEGGALLVFDDKHFVPDRSFRILIEGTTMILLCEMRHKNRAGVGVRFMRPSEGAELNRYFLTKPVEVAKVQGSEVRRRVAILPPVLRGQDLRASLHLVHSAVEIGNRSPTEPDKRVSRSALKAGLLRVRRALGPVRERPAADAPEPNSHVAGDSL